MYVANVGMFEYSFVNNADTSNYKQKSIDFPAFAYGSDDMIHGIKNDSTDIKGLGEMNSEEAFSVWIYNVNDPKNPEPTKIKTGFLVGEKIDDIPAVGGSSPNSIVASDQYVFVSNGSHDCITVIDARQDTMIQNIRLGIDPAMDAFNGIIPFGLALDREAKRLYVAEAGINAVGIIDVPSLKLIGHLPVGWFPSKLQVHPTLNKLIVANAKGFGSGPNGGANYQKRTRR